MLEVKTILYFVITIIFLLIFIHNVSDWFRTREPMIPIITQYEDEMKGDEDEDEDDEFYKKMMREFVPMDARKIDEIKMELDREVVLSPEEIDYIDENDIELPTNTMPDTIGDNIYDIDDDMDDIGEGDEDIAIKTSGIIPTAPIKNIGRNVIRDSGRGISKVARKIVPKKIGKKKKK